MTFSIGDKVKTDFEEEGIFTEHIVTGMRPSRIDGGQANGGTLLSVSPPLASCPVDGIDEWISEKWFEAVDV